MATGDVSVLLDVASTLEPVQPSTPTPDPVEVETDVPEVETDAVETETDEGGGAPEAALDDKPVDARNNPAAIRSALKAFRDLDPKNAPIARELNNAYGRYSAYRDVFPKVADAQTAKATLEAVGGHDGITQLQDTIKSVNETDALLYEGNPKVIDSLYEDFKANGKEAAFGKLASPFLDKLRTADPKAFEAVIKPHFFQGLVDSGLSRVVGQIRQALSGEKPNIALALDLIAGDGGIEQWYKNLEQESKTVARPTDDPERQAFQKEVSEFQSAKQKEFNTGVAAANDSYNNRSLGQHLRVYLQSPFFKNFPQEGKVDIAQGIKAQLFNELTADKQYQSQMDAFFSQKSPDKAKITAYHNAKVDTMTKRIVKSVIERRYPNYAKAGAVASPKAKVAAAPVGTGPAKPTFQQTKPAADSIDWEKTDDVTFITGRAYLRGGKFVTWNPKYK